MPECVISGVFTRPVIMQLLKVIKSAGTGILAARQRVLGETPRETAMFRRERVRPAQLALDTDDMLKSAMRSAGIEVRVK